MAIYAGLEGIFFLYLSNAVVDFDCIEIINLLNGNVVDLKKASFFIVKIKDQGGRMRWLISLMLKDKIIKLIECKPFLL